MEIDHSRKETPGKGDAPMAYNRDIYEKAQKIIDDRRERSEKKAEAKARLFDSLEPEYGKLRQEMIESVREAIKSIDMKPDDAPALLQQQKIRNLTAQQQIRSLLQKHDLPEDYLEVKYVCPVCSDTGIDGNRLCECHLEVLKKLAYDEAGSRSPLKFCSFDDFRLDYYSNRVNPEYGCSPRQRMGEILDYCKSYAATFDAASPSLLFFGETGLGKTHLSLSIAGTVINAGYSVIYNSAQNIFNELQKERFGKGDSDGRFEPMVLECDLLVIDDLGAEFSTQFTNAALYNIVNTRINSTLPTIISTNLNIKELEERYTRRISSRLIGEYAVINFIGEDVRQIRSERTDA